MIKNILITGASQGLGRALAIELAKMNHKIYAVARSESLLMELSQFSDLIIPIVADISQEKDRQDLYKQINKSQNFSIIHNAAIAIPGLFSDDVLAQQHFATNYFAPLEITRSLLPLLKGQRVLHISSGAADLALPGLLSYCVSKAALERATPCLNAELNSKDIYFANLRPGMIDTNMQAKLRNSEKTKLPDCEFYAEAKNQNKLANPGEVAKFVTSVLLNTSSQVFSQTLWDVNKAEQRKLFQHVS